MCETMIRWIQQGGLEKLSKMRYPDLNKKGAKNLRHAIFLHAIFTKRKYVKKRRRVNSMTEIRFFLYMSLVEKRYID